ncbi:MAG TPA: ABC transporter permease [Candidatus Deferrimicrobium sp.]|nr:ABC transporter permease [Candidatus Deferrimicrobium sp.]
MKTIIWREFKTVITSGLSVVLHFVAPLFLLVFFATVFGRNLSAFSYEGMSVNYLDYFTPGLVGFVTFMTFQIALTFVRHDKMSGMLGIIVLSHGGLKEYVGGKIVAQSVVNMVKVIILIMLALIISQGEVAVAHVANALVLGVTVLLGTIVWLSLGLAIGLMMKRDDLREILVMLVSMPLTFSSTMYYDISKAPSWIQAISTINPLTYTCNSARQAYLVSASNFFSFDMLILILMALASLGISLYVSKNGDY